jgi:hypothetical protein
VVPLPFPSAGLGGFDRDEFPEPLHGPGPDPLHVVELLDPLEAAALVAQRRDGSRLRGTDSGQLAEQLR